VQGDRLGKAVLAGMHFFGRSAMMLTALHETWRRGSPLRYKYPREMHWMSG